MKNVCCQKCLSEKTKKKNTNKNNNNRNDNQPPNPHQVVHSNAAIAAGTL